MTPPQIDFTAEWNATDCGAWRNGMGNRRRMPPRMGSWQPERLRYGASAKGQRVADGLPGEKQPIQDRKRCFRRSEAPSCQNKSISVMRRLGLLCLVFAVTAAPVWARHDTAGCGTTATTPAEVLFLHRQAARAPRDPDLWRRLRLPPIGTSEIWPLSKTGMAWWKHSTSSTSTTRPSRSLLYPAELRATGTLIRGPATMAAPPHKAVWWPRSATTMRASLRY